MGTKKTRPDAVEGVHGDENATCVWLWTVNIYTVNYKANDPLFHLMPNIPEALLGLSRGPLLTPFAPVLLYARCEEWCFIYLSKICRKNELSLCIILVVVSVCNVLYIWNVGGCH